MKIFLFLIGFLFLAFSFFAGTSNANEGGDDYNSFNYSTSTATPLKEAETKANYDYMTSGTCTRDSECNGSGTGFECYEGTCVDKSTYSDNVPWYSRLWETTTDAGTSVSDFLFGTGGSTNPTGPGAGGTGSGAPLPMGPKCGQGFYEVGGVCMPGSELTGLSDVSVLEILAGLLSWLFALFSILAIMAFVVSGLQYLVSAGDTGMIETAKRNMTWSVVGIVVGLSGFIVLKAVSAALTGSPIF